jgi:chromosome partitioning protein
MLSILIVNSKGGSGKTTLSTNLASYYASRKFRTTILDYDSQGSCLQWLKIRPGNMGSIHGANAAPPKGASTLHNLQKWVPVGTQVLVIDAPAGVKGMLLQEMVRRANFILVPVLPSAIDIHVTSDFLRELYTIGGASIDKTKVAMVANRVRRTSHGRKSLEHFLGLLKMPYLTTISDSDNFLRAVEKGLGVFEMDEAETYAERQELLPILKWLDGQIQVTDVANKVVSIDESRNSPASPTPGKAWHAPVTRFANR